MTMTCLQQRAENAAVTSNKHSLSDFVQYSKIDSWMNVLNLPLLYQFGSAEVKWLSVVSTTLYIYVFEKVCHPCTHCGLSSLLTNKEYPFSVRWTRPCLFSVIMQSFAVLHHRWIT